MKKLFFALSILAFALSALPPARGDEMSIDFIYDNLSGGNWIDVEGYGYGWQPDVATSDPNWRPYSDGYWAYTDYGWTWISYEDFGWATYHYGRWANLGDYGWVWFPGSDLEWGPAWVSWRTGGDYIGWAPLPPRGPDIVYESQPIGVNVDVVFDIGPEYYNFCDVRFIGEPVLRDRILPPVQNVTYITNTVNVTNITVQNNVVYNYGPDFNVVNTYSSRPIQRLTIERQAPPNTTTAVKSGTLTKVQGDKLLIAAPQRFTKAAPAAKPPAVKATVAQPKIEHGWKGVPNRAEVEQKMKAENPKNIPPPTRAAARAVASPESKTTLGPRGRNMGVQPNEPTRAGKEREAGPKEMQAEREKPTVDTGKGRRGVPPGREATTAVPKEGAEAESPPSSGRRENLSPAPRERRLGRGRPGEPSTEPGAPVRSPAAARGSSPSDFQRARPQPEHGQSPGRNLGKEPSPGQGAPRQVPPQQPGQGPEPQRFGTPAPRSANERDQRGGGPPSGTRQPLNPSSGRVGAAGEDRAAGDVARKAGSTINPTHMVAAPAPVERRQAQGQPGGGGSVDDGRGHRERMEGAHGQSAEQGTETAKPRTSQAGQRPHGEPRPEQARGDATRPDHSQTQGQSQHAKAKPEKGTPPPGPR